MQLLSRKPRADSCRALADTAQPEQPLLRRVARQVVEVRQVEARLGNARGELSWMNRVGDINFRNQLGSWCDEVCDVLVADRHLPAECNTEMLLSDRARILCGHNFSVLLQFLNVASDQRWHSRE